MDAVGVSFGSGDTTMVTGVGSGVAGVLGVETGTAGAASGCSGGGVNAVKPPVIVEDLAIASTLAPARFLTQSSTSGSKRSRSFARPCN
jgi:hypothetical protein